MQSDHYNAQFYSAIVDGSLRSAKVILPILYSFYQPRSVIDIGCGRGSWLATAESLGSVKLSGLDGSWVKKEQLLSRNIDFANVDFEQGVEITEKYDLCISVEVAEHVSAKHAKNFVETLCKCADVVLFSAAIKHQGGRNHINEQYQSYWINLFDANGYDCLDILRPAIWGDENVEWWYKQNIFIFVRRESDLQKLKEARFRAAPIADIVHPENYEFKVREMEMPTLRFCWKTIKQYVAIKMERLGK